MLELDAAHVAWRVLDGVVLIYCDKSGATHEFGELDAWVVQQLAAGPTSLAALQRGAQDMVDLSEAELARQLRQIVALLSALALLRTPAVAS